MSRLLVVETSPRGDYSISHDLTRRFVARRRSAHPDGHVVDRDLRETDLPFVNAPWLSDPRWNIASQYLRLILNVIGITDLTFIAAGGAKAVDLGEVGRDDFLDMFQDRIEAEAA